jgi:hypothetical protein
MSSLYPSKVLQPSKQAFNLPTLAITPQRSAILGDRFLAVDLMRCNQLNALLAQPFIQRITIVRSITDQSFRFLFRKPTFESPFDQSDFMRRSTFNGYGDRKTSAICHCHELCTFAPLGLSHPAAPFLATTKLPSMKHSVKSSLPRSLTSFTNVLNNCSNTPELRHSWKRRWQVWYGGYRSGRSSQRAPVRKIHRMPFRISRSLTLGLPRPSARLASLGSSGLIISHCSSLRSIGSLPFPSLSPVYHF